MNPNTNPRIARLGDIPASTYALFERAAQTFGDAPALSYIADAADFRHVHTWSFRTLLAKITQAANLFHAVGIGPGDVVAYALPNLPKTHFALWGAEAAGVALAINPTLAGEQVADLLRAAEARVLVTMSPSASSDFLEALLPHLDLCPSLTHVFTVGAGEAADRAWTLGDEVRQGDGLQRSDALVSGREIAPGDSSWFCTGGTTGAPKIAGRTHGNEVSDAAMMQEALARARRARPQFFCGLPLFHVNAAMITGLVPWLAGSQVVLGPAGGYRDKNVMVNFWEIVEAHRINVFSGVPTIFGALLQSSTAGTDLRSLDFAICGAAPMPIELFERFEHGHGHPHTRGLRADRIRLRRFA